MNNSPPAKQASYDRFPSIAVPGGATAACRAGTTSPRSCAAPWPSDRRLEEDGFGRLNVTRASMNYRFWRNFGPVLLRSWQYTRPRRCCRWKRSTGSSSRFSAATIPVFGRLSGLTLPQFFDPAAVAELRRRVHEVAAGLVLVVGCGATLFCERRRAGLCRSGAMGGQNRFRRNQASNLGAAIPRWTPGLQYKRAYFVNWRVCDRWKRPLISQWDFVLDTNDPRQPKLAEGEAVRRGLRHAVTTALSCRALLRSGPLGRPVDERSLRLGPRASTNYGWCFDCVPEENSLLLGLGDARLELPSLDLVFDQPRALLGDAVHARFGDEFPIRFDFLDTMQGGNLSFQVHPLTEYIQQNFGMAYTQDESYYLLDAANDACVYLGLRDGVDPARMVRDLQAARLETGISDLPERPGGCFAQIGNVPVSNRRLRQPLAGQEARPLSDSGGHGALFWAELDGAGNQRHAVHLYVQDVGLGPAGTGRQATPDPSPPRRGQYPVGADDRVGPCESDQPHRPRRQWRRLAEERTGLHEREFIETRRHWFTKPVPHDTGGGVNVLNLVAGDEAIVESPDDAFKPFVVHYAETFIVPAAVGRYTIRPRTPEDECATVKAFVRT